MKILVHEAFWNVVQLSVAKLNVQPGSLEKHLRIIFGIVMVLATRRS